MRPDPRALEAQLAAAVAATPRPYALPALPRDAGAALGEGTDVALAVAIEAARTGHGTGAARDVFLQALARLVAGALEPTGGDPAFQAAVLRASDPVVAEYAALAMRLDADARSVRKAVDAEAHPGKLLGRPQGAARDALAQLHQLARGAHWPQLAAALQAGDGTGFGEDAALQRLLRAQGLRHHASVRQYLALCALRGPAAGSDEAAANGRAAARVGDLAERQTLQAFGRIAALLDARLGRPAYAVAHGLRTPAGFPGATGQAKDEWDVVLLRQEADGAHVVLVAEVKAAPAAATADYMRLLRGLQRLALADPATVYAFAGNDRVVPVAGASLRALAPVGDRLPSQAIYSSAAPEERGALLGAAAKGVLLAEAASLRFAQALLRGEVPAADVLAPVWEELPVAPRLRAVLHQYPTAQAARAAMLHPQELVQAVERAFG